DSRRRAELSGRTSASTSRVSRGRTWTDRAAVEAAARGVLASKGPPTGTRRCEPSVHHGEGPVAQLRSVSLPELHLPLDQLDHPHPEVDLLDVAGRVQSSRADGVDLDQLVADDVQADIEDAVGEQARPHELGDLEHPGRDLR